MNPWLAILLVLGALAALLGGLAVLGRRGRISPEASRKTVHVVLGCITLSFPWLFTRLWPVWVLAALAVGTLAALRWLRPVASADRRVLLGVTRESYGELCFPLAVALVFTCSRAHPAHYLLAVAALTFADAAGALIGGRFGRLRFTTDEGLKTVEGSLAIWLITSLLTFCILLVADDADIGRAALVAALIGVLTALLEAIALKGFDNLFLPLLVWSLVTKYAELTAPQLGVRLAALLLIVAGAVIWRNGTRLNHAGMLGAALLIYLCAVLGDWRWVLHPLVAAACYLWLCRHDQDTVSVPHTLAAAFAVAGPGLFWLFMQQTGVWPASFACFATAFAVEMALMTFTETWDPVTPPRHARAWLLAVATGAGLGLLAGAVCWLDALQGLRAAGVLLLACAAAVTMFHALEWSRATAHQHDARWLLQGGLGIAASLLGVWI